MAKVQGALFSMDASGKFGGAIVFTKWKGRQVARQLVTPANPQTASQVEVRNAQRVSAACQSWANMATTKGDGRLVTDKEAIKAITPSGQAWNGYFVQNIIGAGLVSYDAAVAAYTALTAPQKTAWNDAAAALTPVMTAVAQGIAGGGAGTPVAAGQAWFTYQYALALMGIADTPTGTPPTYA